jgi:hypothetical protein
LPGSAPPSSPLRPLGFCLPPQLAIDLLCEMIAYKASPCGVGFGVKGG